MSGCPRKGHGAMLRIQGPKDTKYVPMEELDFSRQLNSFIALKPLKHQGPPKAIAGTGGFKPTKTKKKVTYK